jgi:hypothetical protein
MDSIDVAVGKLADDMWFTRKARIHAEKRLLSNEMHSQFLLIAYSIYSIALSVLLLKFKIVPDDFANVFSVILSVTLLALSLTITSRGFKDRALSFRTNYTKIQALLLDFKRVHWTSSQLEKQEIFHEISEKYILVLNEIENHLAIDDICARFDIKDLQSRQVTKKEKTAAIFYEIRRYSTLFLLYTMPFLIIGIVSFLGLFHV